MGRDVKGSMTSAAQPHCCKAIGGGEAKAKLPAGGGDKPQCPQGQSSSRVCAAVAHLVVLPENSIPVLDTSEFTGT